MERNEIKIGTRGSELALAQAREVRDRMHTAHGEDLRVVIEVISTKGDRITDRPLSEIGGKGLFTEEIEERLSDGRIDIAVHSTKDMPTQLPDGLGLTCFLPREAPQDAFMSANVASLDDLPEGAIVGSSSLRRRALLLKRRPDLKVVEFRGNVQTRLRKLEDGLADATLLALAGLKRLGMAEMARDIFDMSVFPPAPGQGAICIESRIDDAATREMIAPLNDDATATALECERSFLAALDGSCRTPIAGHAAIEGERMTFHGMILKPDGSEWHEHRKTGGLSEAAEMGADCAEILKQNAGPGFFDGWGLKV